MKHLPGEKLMKKDENAAILVLIWIGTAEKRGAAGGDNLNGD